MTAATLDDHVFVFLEDHVAVVQEIEYGDRRQFGGRATGLGHFSRAHQVHQCLNYSVVGSVHVCVQREIALSTTVVRVVSIRRDDPVLRNENIDNKL